MDELTFAVAAAATATLDIARTGPAVRLKADRSPVTDADHRSQAILVEATGQLMPGVAIVAEEMASRPGQLGDVFVLIDPLDGTREYVAGSGEYTVNVGIVWGDEPVAGIVAAPALGCIFRGTVGCGAERLEMSRDGAITPTGRPIHVRDARPGNLVAAISRSHLDTATVTLLDRLGVVERVPCGSALKFCRLADGEADIYPRLATTCEWDVAAGHALVAAAGGAVTRPDGSALRYGGVSRDFRVPAFVAWADRAGVLGTGGLRFSFR